MGIDIGGSLLRNDPDGDKTGSLDNLPRIEPLSNRGASNPPNVPSSILRARRSVFHKLSSTDIAIPAFCRTRQCCVISECWKDKVSNVC